MGNKYCNLQQSVFNRCHNSAKIVINFTNTIVGGFMFKVYHSRSESFARYIIDNKATIRQTAKHFNYSKSLVHNDVSYKLPKINAELHSEVKKVLEQNFKQRHLRGGLSTKKKYEMLRVASAK